MLRIGDFSKLSRISIRMLRHYDECGLLKPKKVDQFTGYRYYSEAQLLWAGRIQTLKGLGFGIPMIAEILDQYEDAKQMELFLLHKKSELKAQEETIHQRVRMLDSTIQWLREDGNLTGYDVNLKVIPKRYVASVRQVIPSYGEEGLLWGIMMEDTARIHMQLGNPCYSIAVFHDGEYREQDVDVEIQRVVTGSYEDIGRVTFKTVPEILVASATFQGGYEKITQVNEALARWAMDRGYDFDGLSFNLYHVGPGETHVPEQYVTEVCYPVLEK